MDLADKVVLITGASRGVGAACALAAARAGAHLALAAKTVDPHDRLPGTLPEVAESIRALGREALILPTDVRDEAQVEAMVLQTVRHFGRLDALVNNAGAIHLGPVATFPTKKADLVHQVNFRASFLASRAAIPHLRVRGGHIVMMSPPIAPKGAVGKMPYALSKLGMTLLAQAIDAEEERVHACALWPVTGIKTAATVNNNLGEERDWREPAILADATLALLRRDPLRCSFRAWLDEEVLREEGVTDFDRYACVPGTRPPPWSIQMVDPDWTPPA